MNAVLIMPSFLGNRFGKDWKKNPTLSPPLGLLYIGSSLVHSGFNVRILDLNVEKIDQTEFIHIVSKADLVGISVYNATKDIAQELIADIRIINPSIKVICGGPHINFTAKSFPNTDMTFVGEGEETAGDICRYLVQGDLDSLKKFKGLYYSENSKLIKTGPTMIIKDLNRTIIPARHLIDPSRYGELVSIRVSQRIASIATSRGCPYRCKFCVRRGIFRYRDRDPVNVVNEIEQIVSEGYDLLFFSEDNFTVKTERSIKIMREIKRRGIKIRMLMQVRVDSVSEEMMAEFKEAGVWCLILGIESSNQEIIDYYNKGTTIEQRRQAIKLADDYGLFTFAFFIIGAPPEREWHFHQNLKFMRSNPLDFVGFAILDYQAGSRMWSEEVRKGKIHPEQTVVPTGPQFGALPYSVLERYMRWSYRKFYLRLSHYWRLSKKCWRVGDFTLLWAILRFSLKLLKKFSLFELTEEIPNTNLSKG